MQDVFDFPHIKLDGTELHKGLGPSSFADIKKKSVRVCSRLLNLPLTWGMEVVLIRAGGRLSSSGGQCILVADELRCFYCIYFLWLVVFMANKLIPIWAQPIKIKCPPLFTF